MSFEIFIVTLSGRIVITITTLKIQKENICGEGMAELSPRKKRVKVL